MIKWLKNAIDLSITTETTWFDSWRAQVFKLTMLLVVVIGIIPYGVGVYAEFQDGEFSIVILNTLIFSGIVYIAFAKGIPIKYRVYISITIGFLLGVGLILFLGMRGAGSGFSYLIGFSVMSALLFGMRGAITSLIINFLLIVLVGVGLHFRYFGKLPIAQYDVVLWFAESVNIIVVCTLSVIPLVMLIRGLKNTIDAKTNLQHQLENKIEELDLAKAKAVEANHLKTEFLANMSHEIRTPLNLIMGFSELVMNDLYTDDAERKEYLSTINQSGSYLLSIIENLLDFSMIESNQLKHSIHPVSLNTLLGDIKSIYQLHNLSDSKVSVIIELKNDNEPIVNSDGQRLKQVFINLINNSLKFTYDGTITVGYWVCVDKIVCFVKDTGIGISSDNLGKVFERFVKIEGEHQIHKQGTGLGLPICKGIIETLGGKMWVESEVGVGSSFYFTLPV